MTDEQVKAKKLKINKEYHDNIVSFKTDRDIKLYLLHLGISNDILYVKNSSSVLIKNVSSKKELKKILKSLYSNFGNYYMKSDRLPDGYIGYKRDGYDNKVSPFMVHVDRAIKPFYGQVKLHVACNINSKDHVISIDLSDINDLTTRNNVYVDHLATSIAQCNEVFYSNSYLHSKLKNITQTRIQTYGTATPNVYQYMLWFNECVSIDSLVDNL